LLRQILIEKNQNSRLADELTLKMSDLVPLTIDPVCGMRLSPRTAAFAHKHKDESYYFCAAGCFHQFMSDPKKYIN